MKGKVKFFDEQKGFGFIEAEDGEEYFVHISGIKANVALEEDMQVSFDTEQGEKGPKAVDVLIE